MSILDQAFLWDSADQANYAVTHELGDLIQTKANEHGIHVIGYMESGFRDVFSTKPIESMADFKGVKIRVMQNEGQLAAFTAFGANPIALSASEQFTALQQKTVDGQENPLPAIDAASVQEVQPYTSLWNANYDCLFFCINQNIYNALTPEQQAVIDECGRKATEYERYINRAGDEEILGRWQNKNGVTVTTYEDLDVDSFKQAVDGVDQWFVEELKKQGYDDGEALVAAFQK